MVETDYILFVIQVLLIAFILKRILDKIKNHSVLADDGYFFSNYSRSTAYADCLYLLSF